MTRSYLTNCRLVLPDSTIENASLLIEDEFIGAICPERVAGAFQENNLRGATLIPGIIDLHSDAIESIAEPRSGIYLPFDLAASQADQLAAMTGITTLFNAVSFAGEELGLRTADAPSRLVQAVNDYGPNALTDQRVHCRYEVTVEDALPKILDFMQSGSCSFVSYMDHSPGQGQFQDEGNYRSYMSARYGYDDDSITRVLQAKLSEKSNPSAIQARIEKLASHASDLKIPFAGHDADSEKHVHEMASLGAVLAEFPMSEEAARAGVACGLHQVVGSVNVIRGGSQRTGMSAASLLEAELADCLCSDYVPATLLPAVIKLSRSMNVGLHHVVRFITANPAKAAGLSDRGEIREGLRADLVAFHDSGSLGYPRVSSTWVAGTPVFATAPRL